MISFRKILQLRGFRVSVSVLDRQVVFTWRAYGIKTPHTDPVASLPEDDLE